VALKHWLRRVTRHTRLSLQAGGVPQLGTPPFLILFVNSICNLKCEHCFVWDRLNQRDDLGLDEIAALSAELGRVENLNLSGGEPFMRADLAEVCRLFVAQNATRQIYVPTNGYYRDRTVDAVERILAESPELDLLALEFSLDGTAAFHDRFRGNPRSFANAMETIDAVTRVQQRDARLRIHAISTVTSDNVEEIRKLTTYLYDRHPAMDHHNLAIIRGDRKNPSLQGPALDAYRDLDAYARRLWAPREQGRFGAVVDPMLTWAKLRTALERRQVVPCLAGRLSAVVYANGDVGVCETLASHPVLGNLRERGFREIWRSAEAEQARERIRCRACHCTNEVFLWPSLTFQPHWLARALLGARAWRRPLPLAGSERQPVALDARGLPTSPGDAAPRER